jgi:hypothetical protein
VTQTPEGYYLRDDGGATGVFLRARFGEPLTLDSGAIVRAGRQFLNKIEDSESGTLEDLCGLKPGECRLACLLRVQGPVVVEIVKR